MNNPENFPWIIILLAFLGNLFLALWVYQDAKSKSMKQWLLFLIVFLTFMNSICLIFYLILRSTLEQKAHQVVCLKCHATISNHVKFCPNCGGVHIPLEFNQPKKPKKHFLVIGVLLIISVFVLVFVGIFSQTSFKVSRSLSTTMSVTTEYGNTWKMRFRTADGIGEHTFRVKGEDWGLIYSSNIAEGTIKFKVCDIDGNPICEILPNTTDTLKNVENGKKYKVIVSADNAKGSFSFQMVDLKKKM